MNEPKSSPVKYGRAYEFRVKVAELYKSGLTAKQIADQLGSSRTYVSLVIRKNGLTGKDGGASLVQKKKRALAQMQKENDALEKFGCSLTELLSYKKLGLHALYSAQKRSAVRRGIQWKLSLSEWVFIWESSGKFHLRGKGSGKYVMSRHGDVGAYEASNVAIKLGTENSSEATKQWIGKPKKAFTGVHLLYPNAPNPWMAKYKERSIGVFKTAQNAAAARQLFIEKNKHCSSDSIVQ